MGLRLRLLVLASLVCCATMYGQETPPSPPLTVFPHSETSRWYASGQVNSIFQAHTPFHSPYEGVNSMVGRGEYKVSLVGTMFLAAQVNRNPRWNTDFIVNFESAGGRGISQALGLAGFTNLDVVRNPSLGSKPYLARVSVHQTIGLTDEMEDSERSQFALATKVPARRIELRLGKMSLPDFFDLNSVGSDAHLQFTNWTVDNNGAWDYAADTRGYTWAGVVEYDDHAFSARYALATMPTVANGISPEWAFHRASGQNVELELRKGPFARWVGKNERGGPRKGAVRVLGFVNHAHMGLYREANRAFVAGADAAPDISAHARFAAVKYGVGANVEQEFGRGVRGFARFGWNEGAHESFAYTEVDQTFSLGVDRLTRGDRHPNDKVALAFVSNAIKRDHQAYLGLGGLGFLLGDGQLNYGRENILEAYWTAQAARGLYFSVGSHGIFNPGYNRDRGPVWVPYVRAHVDF